MSLHVAKNKRRINLTLESLLTDSEDLQAFFPKVSGNVPPILNKLHLFWIKRFLPFLMQGLFGTLMGQCNQCKLNNLCGHWRPLSTDRFGCYRFKILPTRSWTIGTRSSLTDAISSLSTFSMADPCLLICPAGPGVDLIKLF
jgi:hypothetical protein